MSQTAKTERSKWDDVLDLYEQGASDIEICKLLGVTRSRFDKMYSESEAFANLVDHGRTVAQAWYMETMRKHFTKPGFNTALFNFAMKNMYGWKDKVETSQDGTGDISADQLRSEFASLVKKLQEKDPELVRHLTTNAA